jgi:hypothetical protein
MSDTNMTPDDKILDEYSLEGAVSGKYGDRFPPDSKLVLLDADVAAQFPDSASVNRALRALARSLSGSGEYVKQRDEPLADLTLDEILAELRLDPSPPPASPSRAAGAPESHRWTVNDDSAALYVHKYGHARIAASVAEVADLLGIKAGSFRMRVGNFKALAGDGGLGNFARQSREVYERYGSLAEPELRAIAFPGLAR